MKEDIAEKGSKGKGRKRKVEDPLKPKGEVKGKGKAAPKTKGRGRGRGKTSLAESPVTPVIQMKANRGKRLSKADQAALAELEAAAHAAQNPDLEIPNDPDVKTPKRNLFGDEEEQGTPHYEPKPVKPKAKAKASAKSKAKAKATAAKTKVQPKAKAAAVADVAEPREDVPARRSRKGRKLSNSVPKEVPLFDAVVFKAIATECDKVTTMEFDDLKVFLTKNVSKKMEHVSIMPYWSRCAAGVKWQRMPGSPQVAYFAYKDTPTRTKVNDSIETTRPNRPDSWNKRMTACFVSARVFVPSLIINDFLFMYSLVTFYARSMIRYWDQW